MLDLSPSSDSVTFHHGFNTEDIMMDVITTSLWDEPRDFPSIVSAIQQAGHATPGFPARMFLALEHLMETRWVDKRRGLFCLTPLGREHSHDKAPRFHTPDLN